MRDLGVGMTGKDVRAVQVALNFQLRKNPPPLDTDGTFGSRTKARVIEFQNSNGLNPDGIVGPRTRGFLFEQATLTGQLLYLPQLTQPRIGASPNFGIKPPRLIPPLDLPTFHLDPPVVNGPPIVLPNPFANIRLMPLPRPTIINFFTTVPVRNDPSDPDIRTRNEIVKAVNQIPVDAKFRAMILGIIPSPPEPDPMKKKVSYPGTGFDWDVDWKSIINPMDPDKINLSANAQYFFHITGEKNSRDFFLTVGAWGETKSELNYGVKNGHNGFTFDFQGSVFIGARGVF